MDQTWLLASRWNYHLSLDRSGLLSVPCVMVETQDGLGYPMVGMKDAPLYARMAGGLSILLYRETGAALRNLGFTLATNLVSSQQIPRSDFSRSNDRSTCNCTRYYPVSPDGDCAVLHSYPCCRWEKWGCWSLWTSANLMGDMVSRSFR